MSAERRTLRVDALARVEGEGAMSVRIRDGRVEEVELRIYEPPRFFEGFLRGRAFTEAPDITARICGICPVAYQMSAVAAVEAACGVEVPDEVRRLRRLLYCGEWIESHALHVYMLHAPDFLGYPSVVHMARDHQALVEQGLSMKKAGNDLLGVVGGRAIHPVNVRVGGFYRAPTRAELAPVREQLERAREVALSTVRWSAGLDFPDFERDYVLVALRDEDDYAIERGRLVSSEGLDLGVADWEQRFEEHQVPHSTALHALHDSRPYMTGPLARYALNHDRLSPLAAEAAREGGVEPGCRNPFRSIVVRSVELVEACDEALRLIDAYEPFEPAGVDVAPRAGWGAGATEAPRGTLWHRYDLAADGAIEAARIVPPTSQNQATIEEDMASVVQAAIDLDDEALTARCELAIRNYDPCISCATHFLDLRVDRG